MILLFLLFLSHLLLPCLLSDVVSEYEVEFSLALPRIMYYAKVTNILQEIK